MITLLLLVAVGVAGPSHGCEACQSREGRMIKSVAVGLLVALLSPLPLSKAACPSNVSSVWHVSNTASAIALAEAVANCPGGEIDVEWSGSVPINQTIDVGNGTVLRITGVYGTSPEVDGCGSSELFFVSNAYLHVSDVTLSNGNASFGAGGVTALSSVITFRNTSFVNNVGATGGAVCAMSRSNVTWNDTNRFVENTGLTSGGAVFATGSSSLTWAGHATFVQNRCDGYPCNGGAVHINNGSTATWEEEAIFSQNSADGFGGAVYSKESNVSWKAATTFTDNNALKNGGAAHLNCSNAVWEEEVFFESNFADGFAGAVSAHESTNVTWESDVLYYNNTACRYAGAVLVANESHVTWAGETLFLENSADLNGGALFVSYSSELTLSGTTEFRSNYAIELGGAVGSLLIDESEDSSVLTIDGSTTFVNNSCGGSGGAMFVGGSFSVVFETPGVLFTNNSAAAYGGALFITGVGIGLEVEGVRFVSNAAQVGGAAAVTSSGNEWTKEGNGNALQENPTTFRGCTFTDNIADATGGAIYSAAGVDYMVDTVFYGNVAGVGGAMRLAGTSTLENCSFVDNSSEEDGGPAVSNIGSMNVTNCLFKYNVFDCEEGYYLDFNTCKGCTAQAKIPLCTSAIDNAESLGGQNTIEMLLIDDGYWRATNKSDDILACYNQDACLGGVTGSADYCAEGYEGPYCSVCSYGYVSTFGSKCNKCSDRDYGIALAAVVAVIAIVACAMFFVYMMSAELGGPGGKLLAVVAKRTPMQTIKIIIVAWQILTQFAEVAYLTYPGIYGDFLDLVNILNFDVSWILNTGCVMRTDFHDKLAVVTIGPIVCLAVLGVTYTLAAAHVQHADHDALNTVQHKHLSAVLLLTFLVYSSVSSTLFQMFACEELDDEKEYLRADYRIECTSAKHKALELYAGFMIALYPVGIPLFYSGLLYRYRDILAGENARERDERVRPTSELWKPYKPGCFFYEVIECMRRILLTGAVVFIYPETPRAQIAVTLMMAVLFVFVSEILAPYASKWDAWASRAGHAIVFSSLYLGLLMEVDVPNENGSGAFEATLVVANVSLIVAVIIESIMISVALREEDKNDMMVKVYPRPHQCTESLSYASA